MNENGKKGFLSRKKMKVFLLLACLFHAIQTATLIGSGRGGIVGSANISSVPSRRSCGAHPPTDRQRVLVETTLTNRFKNRPEPADFRRTVFTYFHIIQNTNGQGRVTNEQVRQQMTVLNNAYSGTGFQFRLGFIYRYTNNSWWNLVPDSDNEWEMKTKLRRGNSKVLNIYTTTLSDNLLGYASFPYEYSVLPKWDGVVVDFRTLPGGSLAPYNLGMTLVHEVGHWFGLYHTFQDGCTNRMGDYVWDTPAVKEANFGCPVGIDSCPGSAFPGKDMINNFMDYTDDSCMNAFTKDQIRRMKRLTTIFRS
jgi:hypothetical protein